MPDATPGGTADAVEPTPRATYGFGPRESADETRQSQQSFSNDTPTDVNFNAVCARSQQLTLDVLGKNYEASASRRANLFDHLAYIAGAKTPST